MKKIIAILMIFVLTINILSISSFADNEVEDNMIDSQTNAEMQNILEEKKTYTLDELQSEKVETQNQINESNAQIGLINEQLTELMVEVETLGLKINEKQQEIMAFEVQEMQLMSYIEKTEEELLIASEKYEKQKKLLEDRLVVMYESGKTTYLDVLLRSESLTKFLSNYFLIEEITQTDSELLNQMLIQKTSIEETKADLSYKKAELSAARESREKTAIALSNMNIIKNSYMNQLSAKELEIHQEIEEYQNRINEIEKEIMLLATQSIGEDYVGGIMAWPVPGYTYITSQFGMRVHPVTGIFKLHTGTDIRAPIGANFIAANDGVVVKAGWNNAYGNMVMINHGGGVMTLYAHGSQICVELGQEVKRGDIVLKVGSTGYSTGPHAHFEVRINGKYVNPLDYITSYNKKDENTNTVENQVVETVTLN